MARWLISQGHMVTVVTKSDPTSEASSDKLKIITIPDNSLEDRLQRSGIKNWAKSVTGLWARNLFSLIFRWPDSQKNWAKSIVEFMSRNRRTDNFDIIYVSTPPFSSLLAASCLSKLYRIPWVGEFRDLWSENHNYSLPKWRKIIDKYFEFKWLKTAAALVTVSEGLSVNLSLHRKPVITIRNGFDQELLLLETEKRPNNSPLRLVYTGTIYYDQYAWQDLLLGLQGFILNGGDFELILAGSNHEIFLREAARLGLRERVFSRGLIGQDASFSLQKSADLLVFFPWNGSQGIYTSKIFEYLAAQKKIMIMGQSTDISEFLIEIGHGELIRNSNEVGKYLIQVGSLKKNDPKTLSIQNENIVEFSREKQFKKLEKELANLINRPH